MIGMTHWLVWIIIGLLGGGFASALVTWERQGFGLLRNLALGLGGAVIGGLLFELFAIWPGLDAIAVSARDVLAATLGSLLILLGLRLWRYSEGKSIAGGRPRAPTTPAH